MTNYQVRSETDTFVLIEDLESGRSVTNDGDNVVSRLSEKLKTLSSIS